MFIPDFGTFSSIELGLIFCFFGAVMLQLFYQLFFSLRASFFKVGGHNYSSLPVSVIICARNEAENLLEYVPLIMEQEHDQFEVIIVNDSSWDDTEDVLKALTLKYKNLKVLKLDEDVQRMRGKKFALTIGIKSAKYDHVLLTDADCKPLSKKWISGMIGQINEDKTIGLGVSLLKRESGFWKYFFRFESFHTAVSYLSFSSAGLPYMGVGRNLIYNKVEFFNVGGFRSHMHIPSGDDDLFINEVATANNTVNIPGITEHTESKSSNSFRQWFTQKKRHLFSSKKYKVVHKALLSLEPMSWWLMIISAIMLLVLQTASLLVISALVLRYLLVYGIFIAVGRKWSAVDCVWAFPVWEILLNTLKPIVMVSNKISKPKQWM